MLAKLLDRVPIPVKEALDVQARPPVWMRGVLVSLRNSGWGRGVCCPVASLERVAAAGWRTSRRPLHYTQLAQL